MTKDDGHVLRGTFRNFKPGHQALAALFRRSFKREQHMPVGRAQAHTSEGVDDDAQTLASGMAFFPVIGVVAIHFL